MNVLSPAKNMPAIAIITVRPETSTARPEVAAAASRAASLAAPGGAFLALAPQVEQRVVDADGEADEQDHGRDVSSSGIRWLGERDQAHRHEDGGQREQHRHAGGDERAEGDDQDQRA